MSKDSNQVLKAAGAMGAATFLSRILGLVREQVFAVLFGAGNMTDAFQIAFRIPNLLRDLFAEGAMSAALVPTFTQVREKEGERRSWRVAGLVFRFLFVFVGFLAVIGGVFAAPLVGLYASSFHEIPGKFELTVRMTQVMFPFFPLVALAAAFMGVLNACGRFFLPAFSSALFNLTSIITGVTLTYLAPQWGYEPIEGMAVGVVFGGLVQAFSQWPTLKRVGYQWPKYDPQLDPPWYRDPALRRMLGLMIPGLIGLAATQVNILVNSILATQQEPGAVSWLNYAFRLLQFPIGIFGVSLAAAVLPRISRQWVASDAEGVGQTLSFGLKQVLAINLPASAGLAFLGVPIIALLFQYGNFEPSHTVATANALAYYSLGLVAYSAVKVLVPACYALGNTRVPVISSVISVVLTIALNLLLVGPLGYRGLALGTSLAALVNAGILLWAVDRLLKEKGGALEGRSLLGSFTKHLLIALLMGVLCAKTAQFMEGAQWFEGWMGTAFARAARMGILVTEGALLTVLLGMLFRSPETVQIVELFFNRVKKKLRTASK